MYYRAREDGEGRGGTLQGEEGDCPPPNLKLSPTDAPHSTFPQNNPRQPRHTEGQPPTWPPHRGTRRGSRYNKESQGCGAMRVGFPFGGRGGGVKEGVSPITRLIP